MFFLKDCEFLKIVNGFFETDEILKNRFFQNGCDFFITVKGFFKTDAILKIVYGFFKLIGKKVKRGQPYSYVYFTTGRQVRHRALNSNVFWDSL